MTWNSFFKPLDSRVALSAPGLAALAICLTVIVVLVDQRLAKSISETQVVAVSAEEDDTAEDISAVTLSEDLAVQIKDLIKATRNTPFTVDTLTAAAFYEAVDPALQSAVIAYAGEELSRHQRYSEAVDIFAAITAQERAALGSAFAYGYALRALDRDEEALESYRQHVAAFPNHQAGNINLGLLLAKTGNHLEALTVLHHAAEISSGERRGKALASQGSSLVALGRFEEAVSVFRKSIEYRPNNSATWRKLAMAMNQTGIHSQAEIESAFLKAMALAPHNAIPSAELAHFYFGKGRFRDAIPIYRQAHNQAKDRLSLGLQRALNLYISDRPTSAKRVLRKIQSTKRSASQSRQFDLMTALLDGSSRKITKAAERLTDSRTRGEPLTEALLLLTQIETSPDSITEDLFSPFADDTTFYQPLRYAFAMKLLSEDRFDEAADQFAVLAALSSESPTFAYANSLALRGSGKAKPALKEIQRAYQLQPISDRISYELVDQQLALNDFNGALSVLDDVIARKKRPLQAYIQSGDLYLKQGKPKKAIAMYSQVIALGNTDMAIALKLAELQASVGNPEDALATLNEAIDRESGSIEARMLRAQILVEANGSDLAIQELRKILLLDENYEPAQNLLTKLQSNAM